MLNKLSELKEQIENIPEFVVKGKVYAIQGISIKVKGLMGFAEIGTKCLIESKKRTVLAEVVGFNSDVAILSPFDNLDGINPGCDVKILNDSTNFYPSDNWLGRVLDCHASPIDSKGSLPKGPKAYSLKNSPPQSNLRQRVGAKMDMGVKAINLFVPCCRGQRLGIFAGSGVGKSVLISMFTKFADADVKVIGLIGERGKEVQEFIQDYLGESGLKNAILVVSTSDESALARRQAAYLVTSIAEYFRDQGKNVLMMFDSVTRFAMAQREIGLAAGEPPTTKGYTPSVFSELPRLLERSGPGVEGSGNITALYSVLVEGDDTNEPISDAVRSILDGHIHLDRKIADRGRFPAVNVMKSISRMVPFCNSADENQVVKAAKELLAVYEDMEDMIKIGAYTRGVDATIDRSIKFREELEKILVQTPDESCNMELSYAQLKSALEGTISIESVD